jgi:oxygen-independent coproporphyrinogen-3 oxidase
MTERLGIYVSVPFCRAKCSFCNFASGVGGPAEIEAYVGRLCEEIASVGDTAAGLEATLPRRVDTVYFGGGTPSLLAPEQLRRIFTALRGEFLIDADAEITIEAAPGQIADDLLEAALHLGVNRVSLGVQSFVDCESTAVGRSHTEAECVAEMRRLRSAGVPETGADLIAGLPYQTLQSWEYSLRTAVRLAEEGSLTHLSVYMFEVDENSRLGREVLGGGARMHAPRLPAEDESAAMYEQACALLEDAGFAQYEISNFAWQGKEHESRHNRKYWERAPYTGFGLDAHSMLACARGGVRFANADALEAYAKQPREVTRVSAAEAREEEMFLGLRLREGVPVQLLRGTDFEGLVEGGLMTIDDGRARLTVRGRMVSNEVFGRLLEQVPI